MTALAEARFDVYVRDVAGQRPFVARALQGDTMIGDLVRSLVPRMKLPLADAEGRPHAYHAYLGREARHVHTSETVGEALLPDDELVLLPDIQAG
ncbi:MAG: hypothetical protein O7H39_11685 [Gammaproteobacteria bacterium]|jgi:hypothetical protein|nr:hypothetical protein [Gammaproteobacteria bacterium]